MPLELKQFPDKGFEVGLSRIPTIGRSQIWKYLIEDVQLKGQLSVEKPIVKGYNFYRSGKGLGLYSQQINGVHCIKGRVMPSYAKTGAAYTVKITVEANGNILREAARVFRESKISNEKPNFFFILPKHPFL